jgi:hypothetical protein
MRRSGSTCYFGPQPKAGAPRTVEDNPIDLGDDGDEFWYILIFNKFE